MSRRFLVVTLALCICVLTTAQDYSDEEKQIIERGVEIKIQSFIDRVESDCKQKAIDRAVVIVDSLMRSDGLINRIEPVSKPLKPTKPEQPFRKSVPDTLHQKLKKDNKDD